MLGPKLFILYNFELYVNVSNIFKFIIIVDYTNLFCTSGVIGSLSVTMYVMS